MKRTAKFLAIALAALCSACSNDDEGEKYPDIVSEFVNVYANDEGVLHKITNDAEVTYTLSNPQKGYHAGAVYRAVCGYVPEGTAARIYQLTGAHVLRDSTLIGTKDATGVTSVWKSGHYINMQLAPRSQGGNQHWGFIVDSIPEGHAYLSLYHNQNGDPASYTQPVYASLPVDSIEGIETVDSITLRILTYKGTQAWHFKK